MSKPERLAATVQLAQYPIPEEVWSELATVQPTKEDPEAERAFRELRARASGAEAGYAEQVRATGRPVLLGDIDDEQWARNLARLGAEDASARFRHIRPRAAVIVPIVARGRRIGIIALVSTRADRRYGHEDVVFADRLDRFLTQRKR